MAVALAALALVLAAGALAVALSARRAARVGIALPPPAALAPSSGPRSPDDDLEAWRHRVDDLEARCLALEARPAPAAAPASREPTPAETGEPDAPIAALRRRLHERGFEDVRVQAEGNERSPLRVEAVRGGTVYKGRVDAPAADAPEDRLRPARRAFP